MKKIMLVLACTLLLGGAAIASVLLATDHSHTDGFVTSHSGGTNSEGCHNDHKRGTYHCH